MNGSARFCRSRRRRPLPWESPSIVEAGQREGQVAAGVLKRALRNAGILLSGKAAAGLMQLGTFAIAARSLGLEEFGHLAVMLAGMQLLVAAATFQSNQAIVRYGVLHLNSGDRNAFQKLAKFGTLLDVAAATAAVAIAFLIAPLIANWAEWDERLVDSWRLLALLPLTLAMATPKGLLRLFGRFDLLSRHVVITPLARLVGALILSAVGAGLTGWIVMWLIAGATGVAAGLWLGWREARRRDLLAGMDSSIAGARSANPGILRFSLTANLHSTLALLPAQISTFAVGLVLGPQSAALMKVAQELGTALAKPIDLINQSVYPDIARLAAAGEWRRLRKLVARSGAAAAGLSALITLSLLIAGQWVIGTVFGAEFEAAYPLLLLVSLATTATVSVFAVDPTLYALGRPSRPLITALIANILFLSVMFATFPLFGLLAPGAAFLAAAAGTVACALWWLRTAVPERS